MQLSQFCRQIADLNLSAERNGLAILWWHEENTAGDRVPIGTIARIMREHGLGNPPSTRLGQQLLRTGKVLKWKDGFRLKASAISDVGSLVASALPHSGPQDPANSGTASLYEARKVKTIFIGHGGSLLWRELKDFLHDRLGLNWEEFNRESQAGRSTKERLEELLEGCDFAFLVLTAEDERSDGRLQARQNVVHEAGLFQGKLGFKRAIILKEEGCEEFSNIHGLTQIRFPQGKIRAAFEDIRDVLDREGVSVHPAQV